MKDIWDKGLTVANSLSPKPIRKCLSLQVIIYYNQKQHLLNSKHNVWENKCWSDGFNTATQYVILLHVTREFHSVKLICKSLYAIFSHVKKAYTANQNGV